MTTLYGFKALDYDKIKEYTDNFSKDRIISKFQFGTIYRAWNGYEELTVKLWDNDKWRGFCRMDEELMLFAEAKVKGQPKPIGFCEEDENYPFAVVYDLKVLDTLHNLIPKSDFLWRDRIKVALGIALAIKSYHAENVAFKIRNISATHIICEMDYTPRIYDFGLITGGLITDTARYKFIGPRGYPGYVDPYYREADEDVLRCELSKKVNVYAYGVLLLGLITKIVFNAEVDKDPDYLVNWAKQEFNPNKKPSLVDQSLKSHKHFHPSDGRSITWLAMRCIKYDPKDRPDIDVVVEKLRGLDLVKKYIDERSLNQALEKC